MATNYRHSGKRIDVKVTTNPVTSGTPARNNGIFGIPITHGIVGQTVAFATEGVWGLTYSAIGGDATVGIGSFLFWDTSAAALSIGYANDDFVTGQIIGVIDAANKVYAVWLPPGPKLPRGQSQWPA